MLLILYVGSQLASSLLMSVTADKNQRYMMLALPFVFVLFVRTFPAGLLVYWITTNLWTVGQQYLVRRTGRAHRSGAPPAASATAARRVGEAEAERRAMATARERSTLRRRARARQPRRERRHAGGPPPRPPRKKKKRSGRRR